MKQKAIYFTRSSWAKAFFQHKVWAVEQARFAEQPEKVVFASSGICTFVYFHFFELVILNPITIFCFSLYKEKKLIFYNIAPKTSRYVKLGPQRMLKLLFKGVHNNSRLSDFRRNDIQKHDPKCTTYFYLNSYVGKLNWYRSRAWRRVNLFACVSGFKIAVGL